MFPFSVRPLTLEGRPWVPLFWNEHWDAEWMVVHGEIYYVDDTWPDSLPRFGEGPGERSLLLCFASHFTKYPLLRGSRFWGSRQIKPSIPLCDEIELEKDL
jgi:hypothetical protein